MNTEAITPPRASILEALPSHIRAKLSGYKLPGNPATDQYVVPVSGGGDSSVVAILLAALFPSIEFKKVMTDTGDEDRGIVKSLDRLEAYLGSKIERILPPKDLYQLIDSYGGYLPGVRSRWCTRLLKATPILKWLKEQPTPLGKRFAFVGIRADEDRLALTMDGFETEFPLIDMAITQADVAAVLRATVGIPSFYSRRSRSGCNSCFFQRRSERVGLLQEEPVIFHKVAGYEKLAQEDKERHKPAPSLVAESGIARNHMNLPRPESDDLSALKGATKGINLFGDRGIYVVAEWFEDGFPGFAPFTWHQRLVSWSPSVAGAKIQATDRYHHLLNSGEVYDMSPEDVRRNVKFGIFYIEAPGELFDPTGPQAKKQFTFHQGESHLQLQHIMTWAERVLWAEAMRQESALAQKASPVSFTYEYGMSSQDGLDRTSEPLGSVVQGAWFKPSEPDPKVCETRASRIACPMCSI